MTCPCCQLGNVCCCVGENPLNYNENYRRIVEVPANECTGTSLSKPESATPCEDATLVVEVCGKTLTWNYGDSFPVSDIENPAGSTAECGSFSRTIIVGVVTGTAIDAPFGLTSECNRCVMRLMIDVQELSSDCGATTFRWYVDFREGCETEPIVQLWADGSDTAMISCEDEPVVTFTLAP